jgi:Family of unknown function (DUF6266)
MGILISGPNGPIIGKVGKIIGSSRNGKHYVKGPYKKRTGTVSEKELLNRKKFALAQSWLAPLKDFVREGFRGYSQQSQGFIAAKSWLLKNALISDANGLRVDPALMKVSSGDLPNPANIAMATTETGDLKFTWDASSDASADADQIMMLAYNIETKAAYFKTTGQFRSAGMDTLLLEKTPEKKFHIYAAFNAADRSRQSDSVYLGEIKI